ncbi:hypothetical protein [Streptomyces sp. NPDC046942]|uniref:hypothetical protein n=1 Tax=Streptomyces sp. NPDC046942 TaxID=3155137 RepID=UPI0034029F1A
MQEGRASKGTECCAYACRTEERSNAPAPRVGRRRVIALLRPVDPHFLLHDRYADSAEACVLGAE